jgi:hypothetical protein
LGSLEGELRNRLSGIDEQRTMSLRELEQIREQARERARAKALQASMMGNWSNMMGNNAGYMQESTGNVLGVNTMEPAGLVDANLAEQNEQALRQVKSTALARINDPNDISQTNPRIRAELQRIAQMQLQPSYESPLELLRRRLQQVFDPSSNDNSKYKDWKIVY